MSRRASVSRDDDDSEPYDPAVHPEIYENADYAMSVTCRIHDGGAAAVGTATLTFDLGRYERRVGFALSLWDGTAYRTLKSQRIAEPEFRRNGQTATVVVATDPAQTRFILNSQYGRNLLMGYADCHTDDPQE